MDWLIFFPLINNEVLDILIFADMYKHAKHSENESVYQVPFPKIAQTGSSQRFHRKELVSWVHN